MSYDLWSEPWGQGIHSHGDGGDSLYGTGRTEAEAGADARVLGAADDYEIEYLWGNAADWC